MKSLETYKQIRKNEERIRETYGPVTQVTNRREFKPAVGDVIEHGGTKYQVTAVGSKVLYVHRLNDANHEKRVIMLRDVVVR